MRALNVTTVVSGSGVVLSEGVVAEVGSGSDAAGVGSAGAAFGSGGFASGVTDAVGVGSLAGVGVGVSAGAGVSDTVDSFDQRFTEREKVITWPSTVTVRRAVTGNLSDSQ